eukprot:scaffold94539_cov60-Phaeocystis_antarctica.AAC.2
MKAPQTPYVRWAQRLVLTLTATQPVLEIATTILLPSEMQDPSAYPTGGQVIRRAVGNQHQETPDTSTPEPEDLLPTINPSAIVRRRSVTMKAP